MIQKARAALLALAAASSIGLASAATSTATMGVSISVQAGVAATSCSVTAPSINLSYTIGGTNYGSGGSIGISCNGNLPTPFTLAVDSGLHAMGTTRRAADGNGNFVAYNLTEMMSGTTEFASISSTTSGTGSGNVYLNANVASGQTPTAGTYTDSLTVTLTY